MVCKLKINFTDGSTEMINDVFETREDALDEYHNWLDNWNAGKEALALAGEDYSDADIEDFDIWEE